MNTKRLPWFRMYTDFLNDPKMISLAHEDQRHFIGILALKSDGALEQALDETLLDRIVAQRLWIDHGIIRDVKKRLVNAGLITTDWNPVAWAKRQMNSDKDETNAQRQQRYRDSHKTVKLDANALHNGSVTRIEGEGDTDTEDSSQKAGALCPHQSIVDLYHQTLPTARRIKEWTPSRQQALRARWREKEDRQNLEWWGKFFGYVAKSDFLCGRSQAPGRKPFELSLDWLCKSANFVKVLEGAYE